MSAQSVQLIRRVHSGSGGGHLQSSQANWDCCEYREKAAEGGRRRTTNHQSTKFTPESGLMLRLPRRDVPEVPHRPCTFKTGDDLYGKSANVRVRCLANGGGNDI